MIEAVRLAYASSSESVTLFVILSEEHAGKLTDTLLSYMRGNI